MASRGHGVFVSSTNTVCHTLPTICRSRLIWKAGNLSLGLGDHQLPQSGGHKIAMKRSTARPSDAPPSAEELIDDLASMLKKSSVKTITED